MFCQIFSEHMNFTTFKINKSNLSFASNVRKEIGFDKSFKSWPALIYQKKTTQELLVNHYYIILLVYFIKLLQFGVELTSK